jgi:hypothetical protein
MFWSGCRSLLAVSLSYTTPQPPLPFPSTTLTHQLTHGLVQGLGDGGSLGAIVKAAAAAMPEGDKAKKTKGAEEETSAAPPPLPRLAYQAYNPVVYGLVGMPVAGKR